MQTRKNPRLPGYDYSQDGVYFVTICTADRQRLLGTVHSAVGGDAHIAPHAPYGGLSRSTAPGMSANRSTAGTGASTVPKP